MTQWLHARGRIATHVVAALLACLATVFVATRAQATAWTPNEDDALVLELHAGTYRLGETLRGYQTPEGICVDMADLIQALDLPVRLDRKSRRATGWLFDESQQFALDRDSASVRVAGSVRPLAPDAIHDTPEGWCADTGALSTWLGVTLRPDIGNLRIVLESSRKLPFMAALERRAKAARLRPAASFDLAQLPRAEVPYRNWRVPAVDVMVTAALRSGQGRARELGYEAYASGEVLGVSYDARLSSDRDAAPSALRVRAYRTDPGGGLLGPLGATQVAAGDVETLAGALTGQSAIGRGLFISNRPVARPSRFATTTLRGALPGGWDAELYRNGQLIAFQSDRSDGRYEFSDVELLFGENSFEVVLYGPQGQIRRERSDVPVGTESIPVGRTWYWGGLIEQDREVIDLGRTASDPLTGWRWGLGVERGLDERTSAGIETQSLVLRGRRRSYVETTVRRAIGPALFELSAAQQLPRGRAIRLQALGKLGAVRFQAETMWIDGGYESEVVLPGDNKIAGLRLDTDLRFGKTAIPIGIAARRRSLLGGTHIDEVYGRMSLMVRRLMLTAELSERRTIGPGATSADDGTRLGLLANLALGRVRLRGDARIRLSSPTGAGRGLESVRLVAETRMAGDADVRLGLERDAGAGRTDYSLGYVRQFRKLAVRAEATVGSRGNVGAGLSLAFSLGPNEAAGGWRMQADKIAASGQALVTVYRDDNGDGLRQPGEEPVEGVGIEAGVVHRQGRTNAAGKVIIDGLRPFVPAVVGIDTATIPDPMLQPKGRGMVVVPRPGVAAEVQIGLAPTGEVEGTLLGADGIPREGVALELVDPRGLVVARGTTEFDGYFLIDAVPYGHYRLRLSSAAATAQLARAELAADLVLNRASPSRKLGRIRIPPLPPAPQPMDDGGHWASRVAVAP